MNGNSKQLKLGALLSYLQLGINGIISVAYTPIMTRLLGQSEYGLYTLVASIVSYLSLFNLGFTGSYLRFYSRYHQKKDKDAEARLNGMFLIVFLIMALIALVTGFILSEYPRQVFGGNLSAEELVKAKLLMQILVINIAISFPMSVFTSIISAHEQFIFQRMLNIAGAVLNPLLTLPLLIAGYGSVALVAITTIISIINLILNIWYALCKLHTEFSFHRFDFSLLKEITVFSGFIFLNTVIDQINWNVDKYILGRVAGTKEVAVYGIASQLNSVFLSLGTGISGVFAPRVNLIVAEKKEQAPKELSLLMTKVGRLQFMLILYVYIGFVFCGKEFVKWWVGASYADSYYVALLLISPLVIVLPHSLGVEIRRAMNKHQLAAIIMAITAVGNVFISIPFAMRYGAVGSAFGTFLSLAVINLVFIDVYYVWKCHLDIKLLYKNLFQICKSIWFPVIFGIFGVTVQSLKIDIVWILVYSILYFFFVYRYAMNDEEKQLVTGMLKKIKGKKNNDTN